MSSSSIVAYPLQDLPTSDWRAINLLWMRHPNPGFNQFFNRNRLQESSIAVKESRVSGNTKALTFCNGLHGTSKVFFANVARNISSLSSVVLSLISKLGLRSTITVLTAYGTFGWKFAFARVVVHFFWVVVVMILLTHMLAHLLSIAGGGDKDVNKWVLLEFIPPLLSHDHGGCGERWVFFDGGGCTSDEIGGSHWSCSISGRLEYESWVFALRQFYPTKKNICKIKFIMSIYQ